MKTAFKETFQRDLLSVKDKRLLRRVKAVIETIEGAPSLADLPNLKALKGAKNYFRLRIGDYRVGLVMDDETVIFVRLLHRKDIYRFFP